MRILIFCLTNSLKCYAFSTRDIITSRNEVVAKVMFLHVSVILFTGGGSPGRENHPMDQGEPPWTRETTPWTRENPPGPWRSPRDHGEPPRTRENPPGPGRPPLDQGEPPRDHGEPPQPGRTPPGSRLQNTVYKRPVHILLECILVVNDVSSIITTLTCFAISQEAYLPHLAINFTLMYMRLSCHII